VSDQSFCFLKMQRHTAWPYSMAICMSLSEHVRTDQGKSFLCAPGYTASQTCTSAHIRAFYDNNLVL
jgi:hypothetical protein